MRGEWLRAYYLDPAMPGRQLMHPLTKLLQRNRDGVVDWPTSKGTRVEKPDQRR
ncbi:MAG TPA: hypothetical protein VHE55_12190 [Fimbriimonadaceae bacterium]|nr:hypothetical protein [Fimbriimonadaceae bacterium]